MNLLVSYEMKLKKSIAKDARSENIDPSRKRINKEITTGIFYIIQPNSYKLGPSKEWIIYEIFTIDQINPGAFTIS